MTSLVSGGAVRFETFHDDPEDSSQGGRWVDNLAKMRPMYRVVGGGSTPGCDVTWERRRRRRELGVLKGVFCAGRALSADGVVLVGNGSMRRKWPVSRARARKLSLADSAVGRNANRIAPSSMLTRSVCAELEAIFLASTRSS